MKNRIKWLDIAKCLGIFFVFIGHLGKESGLIYSFVWQFHVPLFFFLSGCSERIVDNKLKNKTISIKDYFLKNFKKIMIPFFMFSFLSMVLFFILRNSGDNIKEVFMIVLNGNIRNEFIAYSLWFLSCLFCMKFIFYIVKRIIKKGYIVILICIFSTFVMYHYVSHGAPMWIYNIDSALYYIVYYALGYYSFNLISEFLKNENKYIKVTNSIVLILLFYYTAQLFFGNDLLSFISNINIVNKFYFMLKTVMLILFMVLISNKLTDFEILSDLGKETLYLCGNEYIVKNLFPTFIGIFGIKISLLTSWSYILYVILLMIICYYTLIPIEKKIMKNFVKIK